jgi:SAM-dependent methyltransferase
VDLGSGTGISSELFLRHGYTVFAVEPNVPMREAAERHLRQYKHFHSLPGTAEETGLPPQSVDAVIAAQAFHWFDAVKTRAECLRILRPGGWAVLLWNTRRLDGTPFLRGYEELLLEHGTDYARVRHDQIEKDRIAEFFGGSYQSYTLPNFQRLTLDGLRGRLLSASYVPSAGTPRCAEFIAAADRLFAAHAHEGFVVIEYDTEVHFRHLA